MLANEITCGQLASRPCCACSGHEVPLDSVSAIERPPAVEKMEQEAYRHVPYDIEVEQALLGAILVDNQAIERVASLIQADDFYDPLHPRVFETILPASAE